MTRKYQLRGHSRGVVITPKIAWDRHWRGDQTPGPTLVQLPQLLGDFRFLRKVHELWVFKKP